MMRLKQALQRRFHVLNPSGGCMDVPVGMIPFSNTRSGKEYADSIIKTKLGRSLLFSIIVLIGLNWLMIILFGFTNILISIGVVCLLIGFSINIAKINSLVPLVVNLNHPFMESGSVAESQIMVKFADKWIDPGNNRLKLAKNNLGHWIVHRQDNDLSILSIWVTNQKESILNNHLLIINQAISLNNAVNESNNEFDDAREREAQESALLERNWLPEEEIEVQGPISRMFSNE